MAKFEPSAPDAPAKSVNPAVQTGGNTESAMAGILDSLPIAAAIAVPHRFLPEIVHANRAYQDAGLAHRGSAGLDHALIAELVTEAANGNGRAVKRWQAPDPVIRRQLDISAVQIINPALRGPHYLISFVDRTVEIETRLNLRREMVNDSLTGLPNRIGFEEMVQEKISELASQRGAREASAHFVIAAIDITRFSQINECAGGLVGDELIITVARRLMGKMRKVDLVGRLGGNEFGLFCQLKDNQKDIPQIIERIATVFADPYRLSDLEIQIDASVGIAVSSVGQYDTNDCIRHAQIALKRSKNSGQAEIYSPEVLDSARRRFTLETELRKAIENDQLELHFQPLIDMNSGLVTGFEALARWEDSAEGPIRPYEFIPVAEDCGLIVPLGRWALTKALDTLASWDRKAGRKLPLKMNVNVSAVQFARDDIPSMVSQALRKSKIAPERLVLELTESVVVADPDRAVAVMQALRELNISLAMDDFGTGYSNLAFLQQLPIDVLKIDRSFVSRMLEDKDKVAIVRAILSLASALGMETTAEGIESLELFNTLAALGCSYGQGHYFAAPLRAADAYAYAREQGIQPARAS